MTEMSDDFAFCTVDPATACHVCAREYRWRTRAETAEAALREARVLLDESRKFRCQGDWCGGCFGCGAWDDEPHRDDCRLRAVLGDEHG